MRTLNQVLLRGEGNWVVEADIASFFDQLDRSQLVEIIQRRIPDGSVKRLIGKGLYVGILDGEERTTLALLIGTGLYMIRRTTR